MSNKFKFVHNLSDSEIRSIFEDEMRSQGLLFDGSDSPIIMDGKTRYVKVENRSKGKKNSRSGWYSGHLGDFPNGRFGWLHGENPLYTWSLYQHLKNKGGSVEFVELTEDQVKENEKKRAREEKRRAEQERQRAAFSKAYSIIEWERSLPLREHPYTTKKNFSISECEHHARILNPNNFTAPELREILDRCYSEYNTPSNIRKLIEYQVENITYRGFNIILQGQLIDGSPTMLQFIFNKKSKSDKDKHFPAELVKQNSFLNLGRKLDSDCTEVIICEGWATGISLSRFTQGDMPILVAWDSGNMTSVAIEVRRVYPDIKIFSGNDNDHTKPLSKNAGVKGGRKTCFAVGAYMLTPPFDTNNPDHEKLSDWNDIDSAYPPHESSRIFYETLNNAVYTSAILNPDKLLLSNENAYHISKGEVDIESSTAWNIHWLTIIRMICKGVQSLNLPENEQLAMYKTRVEQIAPYFKAKGWDQINRIYDASLDPQISDIFHDFVLALNDSELHIMHDTALMSALLKQLKTIQIQMPNFTLLPAVRDQIASRYSFETANLCMPYHIKMARYFTKTPRLWQEDVAKAITLKLDHANPTIVIPWLINTNETKYWEKPTAEDRINAARDDIADQYDLHDPYPPSEEDCADQVNRIKFLQVAINKYLIEESSEESFKYLTRMLERFNEVEETDISIIELVS